MVCILLLPSIWHMPMFSCCGRDYTGDRLRWWSASVPPPEGAQAISDEAGQVWRAGRSTPPDMVDSSILRIDSGLITTESLTEEASRPEVCIVVVWAKGPERFGHLEALEESLAEEGYEPMLRFEEPRAVYERTDCSPLWSRRSAPPRGWDAPSRAPDSSPGARPPPPRRGSPAR